jgi:hypothetical protein
MRSFEGPPLFCRLLRGSTGFITIILNPVVDRSKTAHFTRPTTGFRIIFAGEVQIAAIAVFSLTSLLLFQRLYTSLGSDLF